MIQQPAPLPALPPKPEPKKAKPKKVSVVDKTKSSGDAGHGYEHRHPVDIQKRLAGMSRGGIDYLEALQKIAYDVIEASPSQRIEALKTLLAYQFGKPVTPTQIDGTVDVTHHIGEGMSEAELVALLNAPADAPEGNDTEA